VRSTSRTAVITGVLVLALAAALIAVVARATPDLSTTGSTAEVPAAEFGDVGDTEVVPCPEFLVHGAAFTATKDEVEGETFSCGVVVVPENHDEPSGRTFELFYLKLHSRTQPAGATPLVYLAGGPGGSGSYELTANPALKKNIDRVRETRDVLAYDQRGTGYSNYLLCAPFEATLGILQDRDRNPQIAQTIKDLQDTELGVGYGALRANLCGVGTRLLADVDLTQYNSVASARDIPALVSALGYTEGYGLYGTSYGTRLAQEAMRSDPDGVRAVVLDGVSGPSIPNVMLSATKFVGPYVAIFEQCEQDPACNEAYPDLANRFGALLDKLEKQPLVVDPPLVVFPALSVVFPPVLTQIDPAFFQQLASLNNIALGGGFAAQVPAMIKAAEEGDTDFFRTTRIAAQDSDVTPPEQAADTGGGAGKLPFESEQPLFELPLVTILTVAQKAAAEKDPTIDTQWLTIALGDLALRLLKGENQADLMESLLRLTVVPNEGADVQNLVDYAEGNLSPTSAIYARTIAAKMDRNDVRATMWAIQDVAMALGTEPDQRSYSTGMQNAVNCSDEVAFTSLEVAEKDAASTAYPQLLAFPVSANEQTIATCLSYPTVLDRSVTEPVESDIPALLFTGSLDTETPVGWGEIVATGLSRSTLVEFKNMGHVAAAKDLNLCVGDLAAALMADPQVPLDLSCTESPDYRLTFVVD
jgi:pimeloyl-ACP methyl ester carboxylesterase